MLRNRPEVAIEDVIERHKAQAWQERTWVHRQKPCERCESAILESAESTTESPGGIVRCYSISPNAGAMTFV